jgi:hypothetical protein
MLPFVQEARLVYRPGTAWRRFALRVNRSTGKVWKIGPPQNESLCHEEVNASFLQELCKQVSCWQVRATAVIALG